MIRVIDFNPDKLDSYGSDGTMLLGGRTAYGGAHGAFGVYHRYAIPNVLTPPYTVSGTIEVLARQQPYEFEWGGVPGYEPGVVIHPIHVSNDLNTIVRFGSLRQKVVAVSAECEDGYGFRGGFPTLRDRADSFDPVGIGPIEFHCVVSSHRNWRLELGRRVVAHVIEREPQTIPTQPVGWGIRLDFFDARITNLRVTEEIQ